MVDATLFSRTGSGLHMSKTGFLLNWCLSISQVYSSSEYLAHPSSLSFTSCEQSHSMDKEDRTEGWDRSSGDEEKSRFTGTETR